MNSKDFVNSMKKPMYSESDLRNLLGVPAKGDIFIVEIDSEIAKTILNCNNIHNRKVSGNQVTKLQKQFKNGDYFLSTTCIGFDRKGTLVDGQHRLMAMSNTPDVKFKIGVMFGVSQKMDMDTGKTRSLKDNALLFSDCDERLRKEDYSVCLELLKPICNFASGSYRVCKLSQKEQVDIANYFADKLVECADAGLFAKNKELSASAVLSAYFVAYCCGVSMKTLIRVKNIMNSQMYSSEYDRPISGCRTKLCSIEGGGREPDIKRYMLIQECIYRVETKKKGSNYSKSIYDSRARYILDYIPHVKGD